MGKPFGKWVIPVQVHGVANFNLLAVWACPVGTKRANNYIGQVFRCLEEQSGWFRNAPVVVAGDFNSNSQWDEDRPGRNHTEVVRLFGGHGLISAYRRMRRRKMEPLFNKVDIFNVLEHQNQGLKEAF